MNFLDQLWKGIPAVNAVDEAQREFADIGAEGAAAVLASLHRASFLNVDAADSAAAVAQALEHPQVAPVVIPHEGTEGEGTPGFGVAWLRRAVTGYVAPQWLTVDSYNARPRSPRSPSPGADSSSPLSAQEAAIAALVTAVLDDRAPGLLLPPDEVVLVPFPRRLGVNFSDYTTVRAYPPHDPLFDELWAHAAGGVEQKHAAAVAELTKDQFVAWFAGVYCYTFGNATPMRAAAAAEPEWYDAIAVTGRCTFDVFRRVCQHVARLYCRATDFSSFFTGYLAAASASADGSSEGPVRCPDASANLLLDPEALHVRDELGEEAEERDFFSRETQNRVLVVGSELTGKSTLGAALARRLNAVHLDVYTLAKDATADEGDAIGRELSQHVAAGTPIPLSLQALLVKRCLQQPATAHRGYVLSDIPNAAEGDVAAVEDFAKALELDQQLPQAVVTMRTIAALYPEWRARGAQEGEDAYQAELQRREDEENARAQLAAAAAAKEERAQHRAERAERKAKVDAGELEATEEELAQLLEQLEEDEREAEQEAADEAEQQQLLEEANVDEDGNPLEPEAIVERAAAAKREVERRRFLADLARLITSARALPPSVIDDGAPQALTTKLAPLAHAVDICTRRGRAIDVSCFDATEQQLNFVVERLKLVPSTVPREPQLPDEDMQDDAAEPGAEGDLARGEAKMQFMTETLGGALSSWQRHCPVTWREQRVLVEGSPAISCMYRGFIYCFASAAKLQRFIASPHPFLLEPVVKHAPVLCLYRHGSAAAAAGIDRAAFEAQLAERLQLTPLTLEEFHRQWTQHEAEVARRAAIATARMTEDEQRVAQREERRRKRLEAEAKKRKAAEKGKKVKKKAEDDGAPTSPSPVEDPSQEQQEQQDEVAHVETTEERIAKEIAAKTEAMGTFFPHFVSCAEIDEAALLFLLERRVLPEQVVVVDHKAPRLVGEDGEPLDDDESADDEEGGEGEGGEDALDGDVEEDEDGNPIPRAPKPPKPFDPSDDRQYRRLTRRLLQKLSVSGTEEGGDMDESDAVEQAAGAEESAMRQQQQQQQRRRPPQRFRIVKLNTHAADLDSLVCEAAQALQPTADAALAPQDGEELAVDPEPEQVADDADESAAAVDPRLLPGKRAVHQFGETLRHCPVALTRDATLVPGDPSLWLTFRGQRFLFASQSALEQFARNPRRFVHAAPRQLPPPRLWLLGVPSAGKRTLAGTLQERFKIPVIGFGLDYFTRVIAAATAPEGGEVDGLFIPSNPQCPHLARAQQITEELAAFDRDQQAKASLKERVIQEGAARDAARENGDEEVEELDEDEEAEAAQALEFEPEEAEARAERVGRAEQRLCAALTRIEPFESRGYILCGHPSTEQSLQQLIEAGCAPEAVVHVRLTAETFVSRCIDAELAQREEAWRTQVAAVAERRRAQLLRQRHAELRRWRRRNIGGDDINEGDDGAEAEAEAEEPEPVSVDAVRADLEAQFDTEAGNLAAVLAALPDQRVPVVEVNGSSGPATVASTCVDALAANLLHRRSLLEAPRVIAFDDAVAMIERGEKHFSAFRFVDPVAHHCSAHEAAVPAITLKPGKSVYVGEALEPEPEPPKPPKPLRRTKLVTREDEDGNTVEEEEEVDVEEGDDGEAAQEPEEEEEEELEPEPELSPEELEEMQREHDARMAAARDAKKMRAAIVRNRIYFFQSTATLAKFVRDPLKFWDQAPPLPVPSTIIAAFEEGPQEGGEGGEQQQDVRERPLAYQVARNSGLAFVDLAKLLKWCLNRARVPSLAKRARDLIISGDTIPSDFIATALVRRLQAVDVAQSGAVLLNLPRSPLVLAALGDAGISIHKVLCVQGHERMVRDIDAIARTAHRVAHPPASLAALLECLAEVRSSIRCRQQLVLRRKLAFPLSLRDTAVTNAAIAASLSTFQWYCPSMWLREQQLLDQRHDLEHAAEFLGRAYCFSSPDKAEEFFLHPATFSGEDGPRVAPLPERLPQRLDDAAAAAASSRADALELCGCCPVTLFETRNEVGLRGVSEPRAVRGRSDLVVEYEGRLYTVADEAAMCAFLRRPWVYVRGAVLPLPHKLPIDPAQLKSLPDEEYVARSLYEDVARAMLMAARTRPKFPGLSVEESALKYVALFLKANNKSLNEFRAESYRRYLDQFAERATLYQSIATTAPEAAEERELFDRRCAVWDSVQDDQSCFKEYIKLRADGVEAAGIDHQL